jgi:hypothetical protein
VKNSVRSLKLGWLGTVYSGEGWVKLKDCFAFRAHSSSFKLAIPALCFWISASCCIARSLFLVLANSSASLRSLASSASCVGLGSGSASPWVSRAERLGSSSKEDDAPLVELTVVDGENPST